MNPLTLLVVASLSAALPNWIWNRAERDGTGTVEFAQVVDLKEKPKSANLTATADFASLQIRINGRVVANAEAYDPPLSLDVADFLSRGENRLTFHAEGVEGPSAIAARLTVNGKTLLLSGSGWESAISFGETRPGRFESNVFAEISPLDEYNQWKEASAGDSAVGAKLTGLPPGFEAELLRLAEPEEGSWVSLELDPKGRLLIGREKAGILRLTLPESGDSGISVEVVNEDLKECRGLLWAHDSLYANANNSKGLYRLRDTNGDDQFDEIQLLKSTEGGVGHGRNDLAQGPDGRLYAIHGDSVKPPEGVNWRTAKEDEAVKPQGYVVTFDPDGINWEIVARGLRNPYGIAFHPDGEMFTYDADNEGDIGLPLYRPARVNHLVPGANYGWRQADDTWSWPVYAPDGWPTTLDLGRGSPTAVKFGTRSNFPAQFRESLFVLDWAYGRVIAVQLIPRGASYHASAKTFLRGRPLNVTDLEFGKDGSMFLITGGRKTQAALYRIRYVGEPAEEAEPTAQSRARSGFSAKRRELRRVLESGEATPDQLQPHLTSADPWIRGAARFALERILESEPRSLPAARSLSEQVALLLLQTRLGREIPRSWAKVALSGLPARHDKLSLLRSYEIAGVTWPEIADQLLPHYPGADAGLNREIGKTLVRLQNPDAIAPSLQWLGEANSQPDRLHILEQLSALKSGWKPEQRETYFRALLHAKRFSNGDRNLPGFLLEIENRALENVPEAQRAAFAALLQDQPEPAPVVEREPREFVKNWQRRDLVPLDLDGRNRERGVKLFHAAQCSRCHQFGKIGTPVGPDLTMVSRRFAPVDLLESILDPSSVVSEAHQNLLIQKADGSTLLGRLIREDIRKSQLMISVNPFAPTQLTTVAKSEIVALEPSTVSPMPMGLLNAFHRDEILDLLAYLTAVR
tara:strand:- start:14125 stop:16884 length:2760 start_codon:yes stop_codon:yes gene_type:complete